jgi:hypothetical protein
LQWGDYENGFEAFESRWTMPVANRRSTSLPTWTGEPLDGRRLLVEDEQGLGDVLQFSRFLPELKRRGAGRVVLECRPALREFMASAPGVDAVVGVGEGDHGCRLSVPLLSLPRLLGVTLETLPCYQPTLRVPLPAQLLPEDGCFRMGLVWAGNPHPRDRSCPLALLLPLFGDPRIAGFSFQFGPRAADLAAMGANLVLTDLSTALHGFAATAAMLGQMDLLVTVDTSSAHLAGAMNIPTFLLLHYVSEWRWMDRIETSAWYPSMTLFRQHAPNRWDRVLESLMAAIGRQVEKAR